VVDGYLEARTAENFARVCELYTAQLRSQQTASGDCVAALRREAAVQPGTTEGEIIDVRVNGERAVAEIDVSQDSEPPSRQTLLLRREDGGWRISGLQ
jgi:hypothetical protein